MPIRLKNQKNIATSLNAGQDENKTTESSAGLANNKAIMQFLNNKTNAKLYIEIAKTKCNAHKKGINNIKCVNCVGKCTEYFYLKEISKRIVKIKSEAN